MRSFHDEQARNKRDSLLLLIVVGVVLFALILSISYLWDPASVYIMVPLAALITAGYTWGNYMFGDRIILSYMKARPAEGPQFTYPHNTVEGLAIAAGIPSHRAHLGAHSSEPLGLVRRRPSGMGNRGAPPLHPTDAEHLRTGPSIKDLARQVVQTQAAPTKQGEKHRPRVGRPIPHATHHQARTWNIANSVCRSYT